MIPSTKMATHVRYVMCKKTIEKLQTFSIKYVTHYYCKLLRLHWLFGSILGSSIHGKIVYDFVQSIPVWLEVIQIKLYNQLNNLTYYFFCESTGRYNMGYTFLIHVLQKYFCWNRSMVKSCGNGIQFLTQICIKYVLYMQVAIFKFT